MTESLFTTHESLFPNVSREFLFAPNDFVRLPSPFFSLSLAYTKPPKGGGGRGRRGRQRTTRTTRANTRTRTRRTSAQRRREIRRARQTRRRR